MHTHDHAHHKELVEAFFTEQQEIFESSHQAMYAFLDDDSRVCNAKFAKLLGYASAEEWANLDVEGAFPNAFVDPKSQQSLVEAFQNAMENSEATSLKVSWKKKSGGSVATNVILVPVVFQGHVFALHFIS